jgi:hypothetical protein
MIIKGAARGNARQLAEYLVGLRDNDRTEPFYNEGTTTPDDILQSLLDMEALGSLSKGEKTIYHAQISPGKKDSLEMSDEQYLRSIRILAEKLGFKDQPFVSRFHYKKDGVHLHVAWQRYSPEKKRLISDSKNYERHDKAREQMEIEFGHARTRGKDPKHNEVQREAFEAWQKTKTGPEFVDEMKQRGYTVAKSNRKRPFQVVDHETGITYELTRKLKDRATETYIKANDVWKRLDGMDLPNDKDAMQRINTVREAKKEVQEETWETERARKMREFLDQWKSASDKKRGKDNDYSL